MKKKNFYVTTPIYYVSGNPHLGSLYSTVLADVAARWYQLTGYDSFFLTGTDEHGQKIAEAAKKAGKKPQEFVDDYAQNYKQVWKDFHIDYSKFIRTTDEEHKKGVLALIEVLKQHGDIYKGEYTGWYCIPDETFVPGQQSEGQGPVCPSCGRPTVYMAEPCYFFKLSAYQDRLLDFYKNNPDFIMPVERLNEVVSFVEAGLKDLCISRSTISWGIPFPGDPEQIVYVWLDALTNYISAIGYGDKERAKEFAFRWPADVHILGKDIVRFHAIYWPAFLMAADLPLPKKLLVHGWITVDGRKMSKSFGNFIDPLQLLKLYGADPVRYYLVSRFSVAQDGDFTFNDFEHTITQDLANELGNLLNRMLVLAHKHGTTSLAPVKPMLTETKKLQAEYKKFIKQVCVFMQTYSFHMACAEIKRFIGQVNAYVHAMQPWVIAETDRAAFIETITIVSGSLYAIAHVLWPVMPQKMEQLLLSLGKNFTETDATLSTLNPWGQSFDLGASIVLFEKVDGRFKSLESKSESKTVSISEISAEAFAAVHMVVGTVVQAEVIEKSDKLLRLQVNCGEYGMRQILAGVKAYYKPEELIGQQGVFVVNLSPRKMMGLESQGMMLFAHGAQRFELVKPNVSVADGTRIS